jgi:hypothetical protein
MRARWATRLTVAASMAMRPSKITKKVKVTRD